MGAWGTVLRLLFDGLTQRRKRYMCATIPLYILDQIVLDLIANNCPVPRKIIKKTEITTTCANFKSRIPNKAKK